MDGKGGIVRIELPRLSLSFTRGAAERFYCDQLAGHWKLNSSAPWTFAIVNMVSMVVPRIIMLVYYVMCKYIYVYVHYVVVSMVIWLLNIAMNNPLEMEVYSLDNHL